MTSAFRSLLTRQRILNVCGEQVNPYVIVLTTAHRYTENGAQYIISNCTLLKPSN